MKPSHFSRRQFLGIAGGAAASCVAPVVAAQVTNSPVTARKPVLHVGDFKKIYDPSIGEKEKWYINDHTFIRAEDGQWHLFGITHREPAAPLDEKIFAHATAPNLMGPWTRQDPILPANKSAGETHVWAPYVLRNDGSYWMYYCGGGVSDKGGEDHAKYRIHLATSTDLFHWERSSANPMVVDGYDARDPMVLKVDDQWVLYYTATSTPHGGNHTVESVTSQDLTHWSNKKEVFRHPEVGTYGGPTESPFVVSRNGKHYLFVCTNAGYNQSAVYESDSPFHWDMANEVGKFPAHAAEIIQTPEGKWYASRAGWGQGGVYLAELNWET